MTKRCNRCKEELPLDAFHKSSTNKDGRQRRCAKCTIKYNLARYHKNPEKFRAYQKKYDKDSNAKLRARLRKYGLTQEEFDSMMCAAAGRCALCNKQADLFIDHCHKTQKIRGLLCLQCNTALGNFQDDVLLLKKAIQYLAPLV